MAEVLTMGSTVACPHSSPFITSSTAKLKVSGQKVLIAPAATTWPIGASNVPCATILSITGGQLSKLLANGQQTLGSGMTGTTSGQPQSDPLSVQAKQTKLTAK
jgi:hypothetical protein